MSYLVVIEAMFDLLTVHIDGVVVVFGVHNESTPFSPTWRNVGSVVFI